MNNYIASLYVDVITYKCPNSNSGLANHLQSPDQMKKKRRSQDFENLGLARMIYCLKNNPLASMPSCPIFSPCVPFPTSFRISPSRSTIPIATPHRFLAAVLSRVIRYKVFVHEDGPTLPWMFYYQDINAHLDTDWLRMERVVHLDGIFPGFDANFKNLQWIDVSHAVHDQLLSHLIHVVSYKMTLAINDILTMKYCGVIIRTVEYCLW